MLYQNPSAGLVEGQILRRLPKSKYICQSGPSYFVCRSPFGIKIQNIFSAGPAAPDAGVARAKAGSREPRTESRELRAENRESRTDGGTKGTPPDAATAMSRPLDASVTSVPDAGVDAPVSPDAEAISPDAITVRLDAGVPEDARREAMGQVGEQLRGRGVFEDTIQKILGFLSRKWPEIAFGASIVVVVIDVIAGAIMIYQSKNRAPLGNSPPPAGLPPPPFSIPFRTDGDTSHLAAIIEDFDRRGVEPALRAEDVLRAMVFKNYPEGFEGFEADHKQSLVRGVARIWEKNLELQTMFPIGSDGLLPREFMEVAVAVMERDEWMLEQLAGEDHLKAIRYREALARETGVQPRQLGLFEQRRRGASPPPRRATVQLTGLEPEIEIFSPLPTLSEPEATDAVRVLSDLDLGTADTLRLPIEDVRAALAQAGGTVPTASDPNVDTRFEPASVATQLAQLLARSPESMPPSEAAKLVQYAEGIAGIWNRNHGLRHKFPLNNGRLHQTFIKLALAILRNDQAKLDVMVAADPDLAGLIHRARNLPRIQSRRVTQRPKMLIRRPMCRAVAEEITIRTRGPRGVLDGTRGLAVGLSPFIGAEVLEHVRFITPRQKGLGISLWFGGLTFLEPATPIHLAALGLPFHYSSEAIRHGLDATGVNALRYDGLPNKISGLVGAGTVIEGAIVGLGRSQGAQTFRTAHQVGSQFLNEALLNGIPGARFLRDATAHLTIGAGAALATGWVGLKAGAVLVGEALAVPVAATAGAAVASGAALGVGIYASGLGEKIGTDWAGEKIGDFFARTIHDL